MTHKLDPRTLAALLSSVVSEILILLLRLLFPTTSSSSSSRPPKLNLLPLVNHLLSSEIVTVLSPSKKRQKTTHHHDSTNPPTTDADPRLPSHILFKTHHNRPSPSPPLPIDPFKVCFHMSSTTFEWLSCLLEPLLDCRDPAGLPLNLSAEIRLGIGLFRLATGSSYTDIARRFNVSEFTSTFCAKQLCRVLCTNYKFWVEFPTPSELESVLSAFELPNCCGVIDCTRFKIGNQEETVVAQIVVDNSSRILNIVAGFRGNKGDSRVLKLSSLYKDVDQGRLLNGNSVDVRGIEIPQYLVGDGGYPLLPWLMVPFVDPLPNSCQEEFNLSLQRLRLSGLKTIASLRNWGVLSKPIEEEFKTAVAFVGACSILHNALLMREDYSALCGEVEDYSVYDQSSQYYPDNSLEVNSTERKASVIRSALAAKVSEIHSC